MMCLEPQAVELNSCLCSAKALSVETTTTSVQNFAVNLNARQGLKGRTLTV